MKYKELSMTLSVKKTYAKPYIQKIKSIIWNRLESTCEVEDNSFDVDEYANATIYFIATEEQADLLKIIIGMNFKSDLAIHYNF